MPDVIEMPAGVAEKRIVSAVNLWRWGLLLGLLLLWEAGARLGWLNAMFFSSPTEIWRTAVLQAQKGTLWRDTAYTSAATLLGFALGTVVGSVAGLLLWFSRKVTAVTEPWLITVWSLITLLLRRTALIREIISIMPKGLER